jgi:hypothetical protein
MQRHLYLAPCANERITAELLDALSANLEVARFDPARTAILIAVLSAATRGGIEQQSQPGARSMNGTTTIAAIRWLELALGDELDGLLLQLWSNSSEQCLHCLKTWSMHLLDGRSVVRHWAWSREASAQLVVHE